MKTDSKNIINLNSKREQKFLNFNDFQKQNLNFDISKLQRAYKEIIKIKKFETAGGVSHFGAICLTRVPGDSESIKDNKARGLYWTKPDKSGNEVSRDVAIDESSYTELVPEFKNTYFKEVIEVLSSKYKLLL